LISIVSSQSESYAQQSTDIGILFSHKISLQYLSVCLYVCHTCTSVLWRNGWTNAEI